MDFKDFPQAVVKENVDYTVKEITNVIKNPSINPTINPKILDGILKIIVIFNIFSNIPLILIITFNIVSNNATIIKNAISNFDNIKFTSN